MWMHLPFEVLQWETDAVVRGVDESFDAHPTSLWRRLVRCNTTYRPIVSHTHTHTHTTHTNCCMNGILWFFSVFYYPTRPVCQLSQQNDSRNPMYHQLKLIRDNELPLEKYVILKLTDVIVINLMQRIAPQGSQHTPATCIAATTSEFTFGILNSVF